MAEEIKVQDGQTGVDGHEETPSRSENRFTDLTNKLKEQEAKHAMELDEQKKEREKLLAEVKLKDFELGLTKESSKYPNALKYKSEIQAYTDKGLSVEEATKLVLVNKNEFNTTQDIQREQTDSTSFGGSAPTVSVTNQSDISKMSQEQKLQKLMELERDGILGVRGAGIQIDGNPVNFS